MTRDEILKDYEEVDEGSYACIGCSFYDEEIEEEHCVVYDSDPYPCKEGKIFKKRKKEKAVSKCTVKFNMTEVITKVKDIPNDTYFTATTSDGTCTLYLKTEKHVANLSKPYVVSWGIQDEIVNYQPVDVEITVRRCK